MTSLRSSRLFTILVLWLSCASATALAFADSDAATESKRGLQRWAVIADPELRESGLSDLVTAALADTGLELVEREQIAELTREIELAQYFGAAQIEQRVRLGQLLKADALILLRQGEHNDLPFVRLIVSDCTVGARLHTEHFDLKLEAIDDLVESIGASVQQTQKRFAQGVERLITVSPLLSKNFTHEFDHLQNAYAAWLSESLAVIPGVAIVELDEARAIRKELDVTGAEIANRHRPRFISGEFEMTRPESDDDVRVRITLQVRDGSRVTAIDASDLKIADVAEWLASDAGRRITDNLQQRPATGIARGQQFSLLTTRAGTFSKFGFWTQAVALQEAALLLKSDTPEELRLFRNYRSLSRHRYREYSATRLEAISRRNEGTAGGIDFDSLRERLNDDIRNYAVMLTHGERVMRSGALEYADLAEVFRIIHLAPNTVDSYKRWNEVQEPRRQFFWQAVTGLSAHSRGFRQQIVDSGKRPPLVFDPATPPLQYSLWMQRALFWQLTQGSRVQLPGYSFKWEDDGLFRRIERLVTEFSVPEWPCPSLVRCLLGFQMQEFSAAIRQRQLGGQLETFLAGLEQSENPVMKFYARCGRLGYLTQYGPDAGRGLKTEHLTEFDELIAWTDEWQQQHPDSNVCSVICRKMLVFARQQLVQRVKDGPQRQTFRATPRPPSGSDPFPHFSIEPLGVTATWRHLIPCGEKLDIAWSPQTLLALRPNREPTVLLQDVPRSDFIRQVVWDGEFVWVGTRRSGLRVYSTDGQVVQHFPLTSTESADVPAVTSPSGKGTVSLPHWDADASSDRTSGYVDESVGQHRFRLWPVSPGRCLVVARSGVRGRQWIAVVERNPESGQWTVDVIHEATKVADFKRRDLDLSEICEPNWFANLRAQTDDTGPVVLMGRRHVGSRVFAPTAMRIDLESRKVSLDPHVSFTVSHQFYKPIPIGDRLVVPEWRQCAVYSPDTKSPGGWQTPQINAYEQAKTPAGESRWQGFVQNGHVYFPGGIWRRLSLDDLTVEQLNPEPLASNWRFEEYAVSSQYGLIGWNQGDQLYSIRFDQPAPAEPTLAQRYPFVPEHLRERHAHAVQTLRELGAVVETRWGAARIPARRQGWGISWRTIAWLSEDWTGGDEGLALLGDLYNLRSLFLVNARVSDAGTPFIGQLQGLGRLSFERTDVTDAGLKSIETLKFLAELRLEDRGDGTAFTDAAIESVNQLPRLMRLILCGQGFTDRTLKTLVPPTRIRDIVLLDTSITKAGRDAATSGPRPMQIRPVTFSPTPP